MNEKDERPLLQRRGGRRISIPNSPISPSLPKRNDRPVRSSEMTSPVDTFSTRDITFERSSIDLAFSSSLFSNSDSMVNNGEQTSVKPGSVHMAITEDPNRNRPSDQTEDNRGFVLAKRASDGKQPHPSRPTYLSDTTSRSSPVIGRTSEGRDRNFEATVSAGRNYSTTSLSTERSASDENITSKPTTVKKSRLNLLNPMSLLARRRSSQNTKLEEMNVNITPLHVPAIPENFDPSIRGSFVHDFSTPRNKRSHFDNSPRREAFSSPANLRRPSDLGTPGTNHGSSPSPALHSPMFKEHFQDDENALQPGQTNYLHNVANSRKLFDAPSPANLPSFAQKLPSIVPEPEKVSDVKKPDYLDIPHPDVPPPPPPKRTPSPHLDLPSAAAMPRHMTSVSSRFSFQIADQASSAQEKLLEERHKQHFPEDTSKPAVSSDIPDDDYYDYDFDADEDFEEKIPGVNTDFDGDDDDDGFYNDDIPTKNIELPSSQQRLNPKRQSLQAFHFTPMSMGFSPTSTYHASEPTPRDVEGFPIGVADTKYSPIDPGAGYDHPKPLNEVVPSLFFEGLRISTADEDHISTKEITPPHHVSHQAFDDMDLYFDDGEFDLNHDDPITHFDESTLDDELQIRDIPAENAKRYEAAIERSVPGDKITAIGPHADALSRDTSSSSNFADVRSGGSSNYSNGYKDEANCEVPTTTSGLTEGNLAAYHDALAEAANFAAANGKFDRQVSFRSDPSDIAEPVQPRSNQTDFTSRGSHSQNDADSEFVDGYDNFMFEDDDGMEDDLMIAEANAEALENDDDGFYGQEFGFYARAHGKEASDLVNGGFFAARGSNGVKRSHSGKANFQEPSLTPITERSEWSARNSVASLQLHGGFPNVAQSMPSPGISQLLDSSSFEEEMTLSALMKLRRGAFGGSSTSINSLGERSMPGSSPLAHVSSYPFPRADVNQTNKNGIGRSTSITESEEDDDGDMEQLTLTQNTPRKKTPGESPTTPHASAAYLAAIESPKTSRKIHHRRNSSGADSVSYVRDSDGRWVLERRRTGDDGEQEIVEREYLAGARI